MVYDGFAFFNEFDLLDIRLRELSPVVDKFILVEATKTFQKKPKPLYFNENKHLYKEFEDKIIHIVVDEYPNFFTHWRIPRTWDFDNHQKEQILRGLKDAKPDDVVIISDLDEIPLASKVLEYKNVPGIKVFEQFLSFFFVNNICTFLSQSTEERIPAPTNRAGFGFWRGSVMMNVRDLGTVQNARRMRDAADDQIVLIHEGGWHFSYMGGIDKIIQKIESWTHKEYNKPEFKDREHIKKSILSGNSLFDNFTKFQVVSIEDSRYPFPKAIAQQPDKYKNLIFSRDLS